MNKTLLFAATAAAVAGMATIPTTAMAAADGQINFSGSVVAQTCQVNGNGVGAPATVNVNLPQALTPALVNNGATTGATSFAINITNCNSALSSVATLFSGSNIDTSTGNLKNTASGGANNVQIQLLNSDNTPIKLNQATASAQNSKSASLSNGAATLNYVAQYYSTGNSSAGQVASNVAFTMIYQ